MIYGAIMCNTAVMADIDLDSSSGRLRWAREQAGFKSAAEFARLFGIKAVTYRAYESGQNEYARYAPEFAARTGVSTNWLLRGEDGQTGDETRPLSLVGSVQPRGIPLIGTTFGAELEELEAIETIELMLDQVIDHIARPPTLAGDDQAYAITIVGDSQAPRFEPGELAFISPRSPYGMNDDVLVRIRTTGENNIALLKRLVRQTPAAIELMQFNPAKIFTLPIERIARDDNGKLAIHRIRGRL